MSRTGKINQIGGEVEIEWKIPDFLSQSKIDEMFVSPTFNIFGDSWYLRCWCYGANGESRGDSLGRIGLYLMRENYGSPVSMKFTFGLKTTEDKKKILHNTLSHVFQKNEGWGFVAIMRSDVLDKKSELVPSGVLTIICNLKRSPSNTIARTEKLSQDIKQLLLNEADSDATVKVQDKEFPVHRNILRARTPVFDAMFKHDMTEKKTGIVTIDDCDADVFPDFLHYVYTGTVEDLSKVNVFRLYEVADKYQVSELKTDCLENMTTMLSVDNIFDVITHAFKYNEKELIKLATTFFTNNMKILIFTAGWIKFMQENATQANELLKAHLNKKEEN